MTNNTPEQKYLDTTNKEETVKVSKTETLFEHSSWDLDYYWIAENSAGHTLMTKRGLPRIFETKEAAVKALGKRKGCSVYKIQLFSLDFEYVS